MPSETIPLPSGGKVTFRDPEDVTEAERESIEDCWPAADDTRHPVQRIRAWKHKVAAVLVEAFDSLPYAPARTAPDAKNGYADLRVKDAATVRTHIEEHLLPQLFPEFGPGGGEETPTPPSDGSAPA